MELRELGLHRIRPGAGRLELVLQLLMRERRAGDGELDVTLPVAAEPRAAEFCLFSHELRVDLPTWFRQVANRLEVSSGPVPESLRRVDDRGSSTNHGSAFLSSGVERNSPPPPRRSRRRGRRSSFALVDEMLQSVHPGLTTRHGSARP